MKALLLTFFLLTNLFAYKQGDTISKEMAAHLGLTDDKIYVIDFFASWCGSCKKEIPLISQANTQIDTSRVEIIGVDVDKDIAKGLKFQKMLKSEDKLNFRVINDPQNLVIAEFSPLGMPTLYYVKEHKIVGIVTGAVDDIDEQILSDLKGLE